jgi:hypothetical protein
MKKVLGWLGAIVAGLVAALAIVLVFVSAGLSRTAQESLNGALELHAARLNVAAAEKELGEGDIEGAIDAARKANARAETVGAITEELVATLRPTSRTAAAIAESSRRSAKNVAFTRRQAAVANDLVGAVAGYQQAASKLANDTNEALERILAALRETNRSIPDIGVP